MKQISISELFSAVPVQMTRQEKLLKWAKMVRESTYGLQLYSNLEYTTPSQRNAMGVHPSDGTAFAMAVRDPDFNKQGIGNTVADVLHFFELTVDEAHEFSCDCGGSISNEQQARRIEKLASAR